MIRASGLVGLVWLGGIGSAYAARFTSTPTASEIGSALPEAISPGYQLLAIQVGQTRRVKRSTFILDSSLPATVPIGFWFWVLRRPERVILVDTGFEDPQMRRQWRVEEYREPVAGLKAAGLTPSAVTDVVVTHAHWDHVGGLGRFPQAKIWLTTPALARVEKWARRRDASVLDVLSRARQENRLVLTDSVQTIAPGVLVVPVGLHTPGFQYLVLHNPDGIWVLASDLGPLRANFARQKSSGLTLNRAASRAAIQTIVELVGGDLSRIVPGHEPDLTVHNPGVQVVVPTPGDSRGGSE